MIKAFPLKNCLSSCPQYILYYLLWSAAISSCLYLWKDYIFFYYIPHIFGLKFTVNGNPQIAIKDYLLPGTQQNINEHRLEVWHWPHSTGKHS